MNQINIIEVVSPKETKDFVNLPYQLYKNNKYWIPPFKKDEQNAVNPNYNPSFEFCDAKFWVAYKDGKCVGRIGAIVNKLWIKKIEKNIGRFTRPEFIDDINVSSALIKTAEDWLRSKGMVEVNGPLGFSNLDQQGLLVEGFDQLPSIGSSYHFDYYQNHFTAAGYEKEIDWLEFRITFPKELPEKSYKVANMLKERYGLIPINFNTKAELEPYRESVLKLFNKAFAELFSTFELPENLIKFYVEKFFPSLNPRYVKVITDKQGELVGFIVALPSLSKAMQKAKGSLLPFGWYHLLKALKKPTEIDLLLTGVKPELQKQGVAALLMNDLWKTAQEDGVTFVETTGMFENNNVAIQMWKSFEHVQHKRKRCYRKTL